MMLSWVLGQGKLASSSPARGVCGSAVSSSSEVRSSFLVFYRHQPDDLSWNFLGAKIGGGACPPCPPPVKSACSRGLTKHRLCGRGKLSNTDSVRITGNSSSSSSSGGGATRILRHVEYAINRQNLCTPKPGSRRPAGEGHLAPRTPAPARNHHRRHLPLILTLTLT